MLLIEFIFKNLSTKKNAKAYKGTIYPEEHLITRKEKHHYELRAVLGPCLISPYLLCLASFGIIFLLHLLFSIVPKFSSPALLGI